MSFESLMEKLCQNLALELLPNLIPEPITRALLETLIGLLDEQQKANEQLGKLIGSYYKTGMEYLIDARDVQEKRKEVWIQQALERFLTASEVEDSILKAKSQFYVGVCYDLLNERIVAKRWYEKAFESANQQLVRLKPPYMKMLGIGVLHVTAVVVGFVIGAFAARGLGANVGARLGDSMGEGMQDNERQQQQQQLEELRHFMIPLSHVLLAYGSTSISRLVDVESQFRAVTAAIGASKEQWTKDGQLRYNARQYREAIADYDFALRLDPQYILAYYNRGTALVNIGEYQQAITDYDHAIQLNPTFALAYHNRGTAYRNLEQYQRAITDYDHAIQLDPKFALAYDNRATAYHNLGQYQRAIADYDHLIQLSSRNAALYNKRGVAQFSLGEYQKAIVDFDHAIRLDPSVLLGYMNRGLAYFNLKEYQRAFADYDQAIQLDPKFAALYNRRGIAYFNLGEYQKAIVDFNQAIRLDPNVALGYGNRGLAYFNLGEYQKAIADYDQAIQLDPKDSIAIRNREVAYELINARLRKANPEGTNPKEANLIGADSAQNQQEIARSLEGEIMREEATSPQQPKDVAQQPYLPMSPQSAIYQSEPQNASYPGATVHQPTNKLAIASLVFGIIGVLTGWLIVVGLPFSFVGLVLAAVEIRRNGGKGIVNAGLVLSIIGIVIALAIFGGTTK